MKSKLFSKTIVIVLIVAMMFMYVPQLTNEVIATVEQGSFTEEELPYDIAFKEISSGEAHNLAIDKQGGLWSWGGNEYGELGDGTTIYKNKPTQIMKDKKFISISAKEHYSLAIDEEGSLWSWGHSDHGELGTGQTDSTVPVKIAVNAGTKFKLVDGSVAIDTENNLWNWGYRSIKNLEYPAKIESDVKYEQISSSKSKIRYAIDTEGNLYYWQSATLTSTGLTKIFENISFAKVSRGTDHILAIDINGNLYTQGNNSYGQLGNNSTEDSEELIQIMQDKKIVDISAGEYCSAAVDEDGNLYTWGKNANGQLGDGTTSTRKTPQHIMSNIKTVKISNGIESIVFGVAETTHTLALDENGNLYAWGDNHYGQLGNATNTFSPIKVETQIKFDKIDTENTNHNTKHSIALDKDGNLYVWGSNSNGQLGNGISNTTTPTQIMIGTKFKEVAAGYQISLAIDMQGNLWYWGRTGTPQKVSDIKFKAISAGYLYSLAIDEQGNLWENVGLSDMKKVKEGTKFKEISVRRSHYLALDESGNLYVWGSNSSGQLGDGTKENREEPTLIMNGTKFSKVEAGQFHSMAIDVAGNLYVWGSNSNGQLGNGLETGEQLTPIRIKEGTKFKEISTGYLHSLAIDEQGNAWGFGGNGNGKIGDAMYKYNITSTKDMRLVMPEVKFIKVVAGEYYSYLLDENNNLYHCGYNEELGINTSNSSDKAESFYSPTQITNQTTRDCTVTFKNGEETVKTQVVKKGEGATAPEIAKPGYTLTWDKDFSNITSDLTVNAVWTARTDTSYKVEYYLRNTDDEVEGYDNLETVNKTGTTDTLATAEVKEYPGFTFKQGYAGNIASGNIAGNGSLILKLYYDRNSYNITYELNGGTATGTLTNSYVYGKGLVLSNKVSKEGYVFTGWYTDSNLTQGPVTSISTTDIENKTFYAKWVSEEQYYITSEKYNINLEEKYIMKVSPNTEITTFLNNITTSGSKKVLNAKGKEVQGSSLVGTGYKLEVTYKGTKYEYEIAVRGDLDGNGKITVTDLSVLNQQLTGKLIGTRELSKIYKKAADIDYSGEITVTDLSMLNQTLTGKRTL